MAEELSIGDLDECKHFRVRNAAFLERFENLRHALAAADERVEVQGLAERTVILLCRLAREDFMEMFVLAANGYGFGATKLLRGLYEKVVTAYFLAKHPERVQEFEDYGLMTIYRTAEAGARVGMPPKDDDLMRRATAMAKRFKSEKRRPYRWCNDFSLGQIAEDVGGPLRDLYPIAYVEPSNHLHPSKHGILARVAFVEDGIAFDGSAQRTEADDAMMWAHQLLLHSLHLHGVLFELESLKAALPQCWVDWGDVWPDSREPSPAPTPPIA